MSSIILVFILFQFYSVVRRDISLRFFHIRISWCSFTGVWVKASFLKSPRLFVFKPISVLLLLEWSSHVLLFPSPFNPCTGSLVTVPGAPITIGIIVTFMFQSFFNSLSRYISLFLFTFNFTPWSAQTEKSTIRYVLFLLLIISASGRLAEITWSVCIEES